MLSAFTVLRSYEHGLQQEHVKPQSGSNEAQVLLQKDESSVPENEFPEKLKSVKEAI